MSDDFDIDLFHGRSDDGIIAEKLFEAYRDVKLSDEASDRILNNLQNAQAEKEKTQSVAHDPIAFPQKRSSSNLRVILPVAAMLIAAVVGVGVFTGFDVNGSEKTAGTATQAESALSDKTVNDNAAELAAPATAAYEENDFSTVFEFDGTAYRLLFEEGEPVPVSADDLGEPIGSDALGAYEAVEIVGSDDIAVTPDGEAYYRATRT